MRKVLTSLLMISVCLLEQGASEEKKRVLFDCQADLDDMVTLLYILSQKQVDLCGITLTSNGKTTFECGAKNMLALLSYAKRRDISVASSSKPPLHFNGYYPQEIRKQADSLYDLDLPESNLDVSELSSSDFLIDKLFYFEGKTTLLCTGPLTNLARAIKKEPGILQKIEKVVIVGGAINSKGNILEMHHGYYNRFAEYNLFLDGKAADIVFKSGLPLSLVPLDALEGLGLMNAEVYRYLVKQERNENAEFVFNSLSQLNYPYFGMNKSISFWGVVGAYCLIHDSLEDLIALKLKMNLDYGPYYGMLSIDRHGFLADVLLRLNYEEFFHDFVQSLKN